MNIQECYQALGGDYENVLSRLTMDRLVKKFALKFLDDPSFKLLETSLSDGNTEEAFRAAHTLKGVCSNLSFNRLLRSSQEITEALRAGDIETARKLFPDVREDYQVTINAVKALED